MKKLDKDYDVIIIGGGATGAGTARDCALRGLSVLLVERFDFTAGATGRNHGLLHSGARYAVTDRESAEECIKENMILRKIARHCVEETEGLFITLPEDDLAYQDKFVSSCLAAGINAEVIDPKEALRMEPSANPDLIGAVKVPDGAVDPFRPTSANVIDAKLHGAKVLVYSEVTRLIKEGDTVMAGAPLMHDKNHEDVKLVSPVSGIVKAVVRGERRKVIRIEIEKTDTVSTRQFDISSHPGADDASRLLAESGLLAEIRQRPYDIVPDPAVAPRDIFVTAIDSAPLAVSPELSVEGKADALAAGVKLLGKICKGFIHDQANPPSACPCSKLQQFCSGQIVSCRIIRVDQNQVLDLLFFKELF